MFFSNQFATSKWGIPEPLKGRIVEPAELDVVLIPHLLLSLSAHCDQRAQRQCEHEFLHGNVLCF